MPTPLRIATESLPWLMKPAVLLGLGGALALTAGGLWLLHGHQKDLALKEALKAARVAASTPVAMQTVVADLSESAESLRQEIEATLVTDPLRAFLRAETLIARFPANAMGAQLLEKARAALTDGDPRDTLVAFQKALQEGDLDTANKIMDALLRAQPGDADLRARAGRLHLALCSIHASRAKWDEAHEDLLRGRALFPNDKTWQARIQLLEHVKAMPKDQQIRWVSLLG